jgi:hypothetical protein
LKDGGGLEIEGVKRMRLTVEEPQKGLPENHIVHNSIFTSKENKQKGGIKEKRKSLYPVRRQS